MAKVVLDLHDNNVTAALTLLYSIGFNDGLREALSKPKEGKMAALSLVRGHLKSLSEPVAGNGK